MECDPELKVRCSNGHWFCSTCLVNQIQSQLGGAISGGVVYCLDPTASDCNGVIGLATIQSLSQNGHAQLITAWEDRITHDLIRQQEMIGDPDLRVCPFCRLYSACVSNRDISEGPIANQFQCQEPRCHRASCVLCKDACHPGPCSVQESKSQSVSPPSMYEVVSEEMSKALIRVCPNPGCGLEFVRQDGCNHIRCDRCGQYMCYLCKEPIDESYAHFDSSIEDGLCSASKGLCPLRTNNDDIEDEALSEAVHVMSRRLNLRSNDDFSRLKGEILRLLDYHHNVDPGFVRELVEQERLNRCFSYKVVAGMYAAWRFLMAHPVV